MTEKLTRYELGRIQQMHGTAHYTCVDGNYLVQQLKRIGLHPKVSRFDLAQKIKELERKLIN